MVYRISLPNVGGKGSSVKDMVVATLSSECTLSAREIFNRIISQGRSVTYQAVHKAIKELLGEGVLERQLKKYAISAVYLRDIKEFGTRMDSLYKKKGKEMLGVLEDKGHILLEFDKQIDAGRFLIEFIADTCEDDENIYLLWRFLWCPLTFTEREYGAIKVIVSKTKPIILTSASEDMPIEKLFGDMWKKIGVEVRFNMDVAPFFETLLFNDFIIEVMFPSKIDELRIKERMKSLDELDLDWFYRHILSTSGLVYVSIRKDRRLAEECRKQVEFITKISGK